MIKGCDGYKQHKNGWTKNKSKNKGKKKRKANEMKAKEHKVKKTDIVSVLNSTEKLYSIVYTTDLCWIVDHKNAYCLVLTLMKPQRTIIWILFIVCVSEYKISNAWCCKNCIIIYNRGAR